MSDYYKFDKVQVLYISRHLTSNAGQALQYIARSSRLDGNNKGDTAGDLRKAIDFLRDELDRIGGCRPMTYDERLERLSGVKVGTVIREPGGTNMTKVSNEWEDHTGARWPSEAIAKMGHIVFD